jgi:hypothetical protein
MNEASGSKFGSRMSTGVAAVAAGAGLMIGEPAEAAIVTNTFDCTVASGSLDSCLLDVNNDTLNDFRVFGVGSSYGGGAIQVEGLNGNQVLLDTDFGPFKQYAAALEFGAQIGPDGGPAPAQQTFGSYGWMEGGDEIFKSGDTFSAPWDFVPELEKRFLGVALNTGGSPQFGWIGLFKGSVTAVDSGVETDGIPICAGETQDVRACPTQVPAPPALLMLATGASAVLALRRMRRVEPDTE